MTPLVKCLSLALSLTALGAACRQHTGHPPGRADADALAAAVPAAEIAYRGMTFAHEGYSGDDGYGGSTVGPSLDSLAALGVNAVSIVPYTFMRAPDVAPRRLPIPDREGSETDAAVAHSIAEARARGLAVLLKPQIWLGGGHWPGDIAFATQPEWDTWFAAYEAYVLHYARLAAAHDVAALCIGTELVHTTLDHPDAWRRIIAAVREVYPGTVTYAANWGEEFEQLTFWDALDVVGLNSYYPLTDEDDPTDAQLLAGARAWMTLANDVAAGAGKPLWLTEVGYRSARRAWRHPHAATDGRPYSATCQARCYAAMLTAAAEAPLLDGMFVWKWPSYLGYAGGGWEAGADRTGFTPMGKAAAGVLQAYYGG